MKSAPQQETNYLRTNISFYRHESFWYPQAKLYTNHALQSSTSEAEMWPRVNFLGLKIPSVLTVRKGEKPKESLPKLCLTPEMCIDGYSKGVISVTQSVDFMLSLKRSQHKLSFSLMEHFSPDLKCNSLPQIRTFVLSFHAANTSVSRCKIIQIPSPKNWENMRIITTNLFDIPLNYAYVKT